LNEQEPLITCQKMVKTFGPTRALKNVDFTLYRGEVCGLIGENGSGKSTLTSIFAGAQTADSGRLFYQQKESKPLNMLQAQQMGVAMIVQEAATLPTVTVAENVFVGNLHRFKKHGLIDTKKMNEEADKILHDIGVNDIEAGEQTSRLNFEDRKIIEIARAMYLNPTVLIIDETTTALAQKGRSIIYNIVEKMKNENKGVIFISHDLDELKIVCNTITVLRDGIFIKRIDGEEITIDNMRKLMVGREIGSAYYRTDYGNSTSDEVILDINNITSNNGYIRNLSLELHKGEILGIGGLANSGMHELGRAIYGLDPLADGSIIHVKSKQAITSPYQAIKHNIGYLSKNRDTESIILSASLQENIALTSLDKLQRGFYITNRSENILADQEIKELHIKCNNRNQYCSEFSGGNKQKVALAKWLGSKSKIIIMDCPTRGIDIGVKVDIYRLMYQLKNEGTSIIMISEELPELIGMSDRILIMKDGKISKEFDRDAELRDSDIIQYMI
jgi:ribose transport system ATP-binding protein